MSSPKANSSSKSGNEDVPEEPKVLHVNSIATPSVIKSIIKAIELLMLTAIYSPISQLSLSPVYGSIPPSIYHQGLMMVAVLLAWATKSVVKRRAERYVKVANLVPVMAYAIPGLQFFLFRFSNTLGPVYGPLITESLTYFPLIYLSVYAIACCIECIDLSGYSARVQNAMPGIASYFLFSVTEQVADYVLRKSMGSSLIFTRAGLQYIVATFYAVLLPSKYLYLALLLWVNVGMYYYHFPSQTGAADAAINAILQPHGYKLIVRNESITGYISVLDNVKDGFRVMRCDHSLLGGEWEARPIESRVKEPIYSVFTMLEAVRLVETQAQNDAPVIPDDQRNALVMYEKL